MREAANAYGRAVGLRHEALFDEHGASLASIGWRAESQRARFRVLAEIGQLSGRSVLDVGCGFADLLTYLAESNSAPSRYTGIDLVAGLVAEARAKHPAADLRVGDLSAVRDGESWDYVVGSGIFYLPSPDWDDVVAESVGQMFALSERGVAVNFLSSATGRNTPPSYFADGAHVYDLLRRAVSPRLVLRHDYLPNDFTIYLYRGEQ